MTPPSPLQRTPTKRTPSQTATRVAFAVITLFVLTQAVWWIVFQQRYIGEVTRERLAAWQRDADTASRTLAVADGDPAVREALLGDHPHLRFEPAPNGSGDSGRFVIDAATRAAFEGEQRGHLRMFAFEGTFFVLVILGLLAFIGASLRTERELKRRQQNFLSAVTHEFKTPISTLRLLVQTAQRRALAPDKQRDYLRRMEAELDRLERTSEQVLASARLEGAAADAAPQLQAAELGAVVAQLLAHARPGLEARGARLELHPAGEPLPVSLDPDAFGVVLNNLLDNAVKYASPDDPRVRVVLERRGDLALVHVDDWGAGVPENERGRIFERFYRSGEELTRETPGVGLGLHLVRRITEAMNGWVRVDANPDARPAPDDSPEDSHAAPHAVPRGSRFTVVLPRRVAWHADRPEPRRTPSS